jgi:hypothetical protein
MKKILFLLLLQNFVSIKSHSQSFTVHDLVTLSTLLPKNIDNFMSKKRFEISFGEPGNDTMGVTYSIKTNGKKIYDGPQRAVDMLIKYNERYFTFHTSSLNEYLDGKQSLIKDGFFYAAEKDVTKDSLMLFQKDNISIETSAEVRDSMNEYIFKLKARKIPDSVIYADDLLQFDSNEFLVSFFGEKNVKKDMYYFSEKELKKCSVLFSGTLYQAVFIWGNETALNNLSYVLVTNVLPTEGGRQNAYNYENNKWKFKSGIYSGMSLKDLLRLNEMNFYIYGNKSTLAFMVKPEETGKINFRKTGIMLSCNDCYDNKIFNQPEISALDVAKANLPMRVFDIILYP